MAVKDPLASLLDEISTEIRLSYPQPGEYTVETFKAEMEKRGTIMGIDEAKNYLAKAVKAGKWTKRTGKSQKMKKCDIYKPK